MGCIKWHTHTRIAVSDAISYLFFLLFLICFLIFPLRLSCPVCVNAIHLPTCWIFFVGIFSLFSITRVKQCWEIRGAKIHWKTNYLIDYTSFLSCPLTFYTSIVRFGEMVCTTVYLYSLYLFWLAIHRTSYFPSQNIIICKKCVFFSHFALLFWSDSIDIVIRYVFQSILLFVAMQLNGMISARADTVYTIYILRICRFHWNRN